ncbi:unnamed protein product [Rhizophagus irregularis]|nr:unnamed protein product [Rhizophagus irregularis]
MHVFLNSTNSSEDYSIESERIGIERDIEELVNLLNMSKQEERTAPRQGETRMPCSITKTVIKPIQLPSVTTRTGYLEVNI